MVFRAFDVVHLLFIGGFGTLVVGFGRDLRSARGEQNILGAVGWVILALYWGLVGLERLTNAFVFLGVTASVVGILCLYASTLTYRRHEVIDRLTKAFVVMGMVYVPFEYVEPVHGFVLEVVTQHTALVTTHLGIETAIDVGSNGHANVLVLPNPVDGGVLTASIISACTGISAIALFVGLVSISTASRRTKIRYAMVLVPTIYLLNIVRNVFTATTYAQHTFSILADTPFAGSNIETEPYFSYMVAEQIVGPIYILTGTIIVYYVLSRALPGIHETFFQLLDAVERDRRALQQKYAFMPQR